MYDLIGLNSSKVTIDKVSKKRKSFIQSVIFFSLYEQWKTWICSAIWYLIKRKIWIKCVRKKKNKWMKSESLNNKMKKVGQSIRGTSDQEGQMGTMCK